MKLLARLERRPWSAGSAFQLTWRDRGRSLLFNVTGAVLLGTLINGIIFAIGSPSSDPNTGLPPGWVIGCVWIVLFGLLGVAKWQVQRSPSASRMAPWAIVTLLLFCAAYPFYTGMFRSVRAGLIGNVLTILLAFVVAGVCWPVSRKASALVLPVAAWVLYATYFTFNG